jgi:hypothetical protein|tara:strand:- start:485 stop:685 length:201 start_codon:yes stop_codon:yes gene_type:complete
MKNFKFRGFIPAVTKYVKSKPLHLVIIELIAFGALLPLALSGILFMIVGLLTGEIDTANANFGIYR